MKEIFKDVEGYEGLYQVSNFGNVKSLDRLVNHAVKGFTKTVNTRMLKAGVSSSGYLHVRLSKSNYVKTCLVHRIVAGAFLKKCVNKNSVNHIDGNKGNNNVNNLEWMTSRENMRHAYKNGLINNSGENQTNSKLKIKEILQIRRLKRTGGLTYRELAETYNCSYANIWQIVNRVTWGSVK